MIIKDAYPGSEKVYLNGELFPYLRVGMRQVKLTDTAKKVDGKLHFTKNAPVYVYDTSGAFTDPNIECDLKLGLPRLRESWIVERADVEQLSHITSDYGRERAADKSLDHLRFEHICNPYRAKAGKEITQLYYP